MEQTLQETSLQIVRNIGASVSDVYAAWTDPSKMKQWMGPGDTKCENVDIDLKVGGKYRIAMISSDCDNPIAIGEYREIVPEKKLVFTWSWEGSDMPQTVVTLTLEPDGDETRLTLNHEGFPERAVTEKHQQGWKGCLDGLVAFCQQ